MSGPIIVLIFIWEMKAQAQVEDLIKNCPFPQIHGPGFVYVILFYLLGRQYFPHLTHEEVEFEVGAS